MQFYNINFGYSQVLFMGSVPRINRHLAIVPLLQGLKTGTLIYIINYTETSVLVQYDKWSKGVSIVSYDYLLNYNSLYHIQ